MDAKSLEAKAVNTWLQAVRLPLTSAEVVLRQRNGGGSWTPAIFFESFEALVRDRAGSILRNDHLLNQARLQRAEIEQRRKVVEKRLEAAQISQEAQGKFEEKTRAAAEAEERIGQQAAERQAQLERERRQTEAHVAQQTAEQKAAVREAEERRQQTVQAKARSVKASQLDSEEKALTEKERALRAKEKALELDEEIKETRSRRKAK